VIELSAVHASCEHRSLRAMRDVGAAVREPPDIATTQSIMNCVANPAGNPEMNVIIWRDAAATAEWRQRRSV
jgi:hypothetical protein